MQEDRACGMGGTLSRARRSCHEGGAQQCACGMQVREQDARELGTKVEVKNMNSFSAMQRAIDFEVGRQASSP